MDNTVIKVLNPEHGKKVIKFFKSKGINTEEKVGNNDSTYSYYGVINGVFNNYCTADLPPNIKIIELPKNEYPKVMWVRDYAYNSWRKRVVFVEKCGKYLAWSNAETLEASENVMDIIAWKYAKDIEEEQPQEFTFQEISEGKATGVPAHLIRIKK